MMSAAAAKHLGEFLTAERVAVPLEAGSFQDAVLTLVDRLRAGDLVRDRVALTARIADEEKRGIPRVGDRVLFPHYRTEAVAGLSIALGVAPRPFPWAPEEARHARILLLVLAPREASGYYLKVVAALGRLPRDIDVVEKIEAARAPQEIASFPALAGIELTPELVVRDVMTRGAISVPPDTPLAEVGRIMIDQGLRMIPVVNPEGVMLGVVTDRELLEGFLPLIKAGAPPGVGGPREILAKDVMRKSVLGVPEDQTVADAAALMVNKDLVRLPVVTEGKLVGFLTRGDIVRKLLEPHVYGTGT